MKTKHPTDFYGSSQSMYAITKRIGPAMKFAFYAVTGIVFAMLIAGVFKMIVAVAKSST